jgi:hypothetical protein
MEMARWALSFVGFFVCLVTYSAVAVADDAATIDEIKKAATVLDEAYSKQDAALIETMVSPDHRSTTPYYGKTMTTAEQIETLEAFKSEIFDVTDEVVDLLGDNAALVTFEKSYEGTFEGKPLPKRVAVSEIWIKSDGTWLQRLYQETSIDPGR